MEIVPTSNSFFSSYLWQTVLSVLADKASDDSLVLVIVTLTITRIYLDCP